MEQKKIKLAMIPCLKEHDWDIVWPDMFDESKDQYYQLCDASALSRLRIPEEQIDEIESPSRAESV